MAKEEDKADKPLDPEELRKAFGTLRGKVTRLDNRLAETNDLVIRAQRLALSAERRADASRLDAHAAEVKALNCKLGMDNMWTMLQKVLEDVQALRGRLRELEDANVSDTDRGPDSGSEGHRD